MIGKLFAHLFIGFVAVFAQRSNETSCPYPVPPKHAVLSARSYLNEFNKNGFHAYDRVDFICRVGYRHTKGEMWSLCGVSGRWYPDTRKAGECTRELRTGEIECRGRFRCRKDLQCIDRKLRCDCKPDCRDGTDEIGCKNPRKTIFISPIGKKTSGVLTSPNYPLGYTRNDFQCHFIFYTDPAYRIRLSFEDFALREKSRGRCMDYVKLNGVNAVYKRKFNSEVKDGAKRLDKEAVIVSCGGKKFGTIVSNNSQLDMFVRLTGVKLPTHTPKMKGYSLAWSVISQSKAAEVIGKFNKSLAPRKTKLAVNAIQPKGKSTGENLFTILLPVTISALLPVSMLLFLCYHIRAKQTITAREEQVKKDAENDEVLQSGGLTVAESGVNITAESDNVSFPLMLLKDKLEDGSDGHDSDNRGKLLPYQSMEETKSEAHEKINDLYTPQMNKKYDTVMTVDLDVKDNSARFTKKLTDDIIRKSKHTPMVKTLERDSMSSDAVIERWSNNGMHVRSCNWNATNGSRKYLDKSSRPQSNVIEEGSSQTANRKPCVCTCNDCENNRLKIERFRPLTCEFDTVQELCSDLDRSRAENINGDGGCNRETVGYELNGYGDIATYDRHRVRGEDRVRYSKRRRKHGRRSRSTEECPVNLRLNREDRQGFLLTEGGRCYQKNCSACADVAQVYRAHRHPEEYDQRLATPGSASFRSNSSDSGTYTGSEAPTKWHQQDRLQSVHSGLLHRSDTDSVSKESAYAESFDGCANFCSCQRGYGRMGSLHGRAESNHGRAESHHGRHSYSSYAPSQSYYRNQDGRPIMADRSHSSADRFSGIQMIGRPDLDYEPSSITNQDYNSYIEPYPEAEDVIVYKETESNFTKLPIDNGNLCREQFFENSRRSKECLVYADNVVDMAVPNSMPSYAAICECKACIYSRVNESFISVNRPLGRNGSASVLLP